MALCSVVWVAFDQTKWAGESVRQQAQTQDSETWEVGAGGAERRQRGEAGDDGVPSGPCWAPGSAKPLRGG